MSKYFNLRIFAKEFLTLLAIFTVFQLLLTMFNSDGNEKWEPINFIKNRMTTGIVIALVLSIFKTIRKSSPNQN